MKRSLALILVLGLLPGIALADAEVFSRKATLDNILSATSDEIRDGDYLAAWAYLLLALRTDPDSADVQEGLRIVQAAASGPVLASVD